MSRRRTGSGVRTGGPEERAPELVVVDLDGAAGGGTAAVARAADPERGVVVLAVSRDPARAAPALAAGASDFALLPRDAEWLRRAILGERERRRRVAGADPGDRLVVEVPPAGLPYEEYEKRIVAHALRRAGWNRSRAARELEISRPRLLRMIARHGLVEEADGDADAPAG